MKLKNNYFLLLMVLISFLVYACSEDEGDNKIGKDIGTDIIISDVITDTGKIDGGKDVSPDIEPDVIEDTIPDIVVDTQPDVEDVLPDSLEDVLPDIEDAGTDVIEDIGPEEYKYTEEEPNDLDNPNKVELNAEISGQIDEPIYDPENDEYINDFDSFEFDAKAGDILRIEVKALEGMEIVPVVIIIDKDTGGSAYLRAAFMNMDNDVNAGMTVFIPKDGKYIAYIGELTNFGNSPANVGGDKYKYILTIKYSSLDAENLDLSSVPKKVSKTMSIDMPDVFGFNLSEEKYIKAETTAVRLPEPSEIDTVLTLFNVDKRVSIEIADNIDPYENNFDSLLLAYTGDAGNFYLIVESLIYTNQKTDYELEVDFMKMDEEVEPNDIYLTASALRIPSETKGVIGEPIDSEDEYGNPIKVGDVDNFYFYAKAGDLYRFTVIAENGSPASPLDSYIVVYQVVDTIFGPWPVAINLNDNSKGKDSMVEALISEDGKYYVFITDARNTSDNPNPVGGSDYKYTLKTEKVPLVPKNISSIPYSETDSLEPAGAYKFYKFKGTKGDKITIDVYQATGSNSNFRPYVVIYDAESYIPLDYAIGDENSSNHKATITKIAPTTQNYLIAILDYNGNGGSDYKYTIDIKKQSLPYYEEQEPNDEIPNANEIKEDHSLYFGMLDGDGKGKDDLVDMYKFSGKVGQVLNVAIFGGASPEVYDTVLYILDDNGNILIDNEDYGNSYYSAIYNWAIPYDGTFYISVGAQIDYGPVSGSYIMEFELINGCMPSNAIVPQAGELVINEFYAYATDDVNNDGIADSGDKFVEIVNPTDKDLLIELIELKVQADTKIKFPCGTIIPAKTAALVFGGGKPAGYFGGAKVFVSHKALNMPTTITLFVEISLVKGQTEITKIGYDASLYNENTSFTRDPDITGNFVKHKNASTANGTLYSPGTKANGIPFVDGYAMFESEPNNDISNANTLPSNENRIYVYGFLKYQQGAIDNDLDDYFKISLQQGQKITLITSRGFEPEVLDTTLILYDSDGNQLAKNTDISISDYYSKIENFEIPSDGDYYIDVQAETGYGDLPGTGYRLFIEIK